MVAGCEEYMGLSGALKVHILPILQHGQLMP